MRCLVAAATVILVLTPHVRADEPIRVRCGVPGPVQAWIVGDNADIIDIVFKGKTIFRDALQDGTILKCNSDIMIEGQVVVARYGRDKDMLRLYRIILTEDSARVAHATLEWREAPIKLASKLDDDNMVFYAVHDQDLYTRVCWKDHTWMYTPGRWSASRVPQTCTARLETKVDG
jgi:hypothetical protein